MVGEGGGGGGMVRGMESTGSCEGGDGIDVIDLIDGSDGWVRDYLGWWWEGERVMRRMMAVVIPVRREGVPRR